MKLLSWIIMVPAALAVVGFSVFNRDAVVVDPWPMGAPFEVPLFAIVLAAAVLGFLCGGLITWISASPARRRGRANARRARTAERALGRLQDEAAAGEATADDSRDRVPVPANAA